MEIQIQSAEQYQDVFDALSLEFGSAFNHPELVRQNPEISSFVILSEDQKPIGGFNLQVIRLKGVKTLTVPVFHPHCGLFVSPLEGSYTAVLSRKKKILAAIADFLKSRKESIVEITFPVEWIDMQPLMWAGFHCTVKYTYRLNLKEAEIAYTSKLRNSIKKAEKEGVELGASESAENLFHCLNATSKRGGFAVNESGIQQILANAPEGKGQIREAVMNDKVLAAAYTLKDNHAMYYLFGGTSDVSSVQGALALAIHSGIEEARTGGLSVFDFEGSMIPGVERFFRSFGGEIHPFYQITKAPNWAIPLLRMRGRQEF